jgi:hypothetical protein
MAARCCRRALRARTAGASPGLTYPLRTSGQLSKAAVHLVGISLTAGYGGARRETELAYQRLPLRLAATLPGRDPE